MKRESAPRLEFEETSLDHGLSEAEAKKRFEAGYHNKASVKVEKSFLRIVFDNFFSVFSVVLYGIAILFLIYSMYLRSIGRADLATSYFGISKYGYLGPLTINIIIGIVQETRSKIVLDNLKLQNVSKAKVIRDGKIVTILSTNIVKGDVIIISAGEQAPADILIKEGGLEVDESFLTGESESVRKNSLEESNLVYSGSAIISGQAKGLVKEVGNFTYINLLGKKLKKIQKSRSELMKNLYRILNMMAIILFAIVAIVLVTLIIKVNLYGSDPAVFSSPLSLSDPASWSIIITTTSAFAIGVIPTGLILMTSLTLTASVIGLAKKKTLIQELYSLESLSRVDTICLDKTGTLTDGSMEVVDAAFFVNEEEATDYLRVLLGKEPARNATAEALFKTYGAKESHHISSFIPFSSERRYSGVTFDDGTEVCLGAPESLFEDDISILKIAIEKAANGYRVLGLKKNDKPLALYFLKDGIRKSAPETITFFNENGVDVKIISGDNINTVKKIAELCGVLHFEKAISLDGKTDEEVREAANQYTIFARVSPEQKEILISALQHNGHKVAMTGDGVNDILALRKANASITFQKATDAAKSCADVVLLDNDFCHLKDVVAQGRKVVNNTQRTSILFLMKTVCIASLAIFLIPFKRGQMFFTIEDIYLLQTSNLAIGGFLLSLEPSKKPITGSFVKNVYWKALEAGLFLLIGLMIPPLLDLFGVIPAEIAPGMISLIGFFAGFIVLVSLCYPWNKYRLISIGLVLLCTVILCFAVPRWYIGGQSISIQDFTADGLGREFFQPWNVEMIKMMFENPACSLTLTSFILIGGPAFFFINRGVDRLIKKSEK